MANNTKKMISDTAYRMFAQIGYKKTTLRMIGDACGITHVNVLYHFKGKQELGIQFLTAYCHTLVAETNKLAAEYGIVPSLTNCAIYWYLHNAFLKKNPRFAETYYEIANEDREIMPSMVITKTGSNVGTNAIVAMLLGRDVQIREPDLTLNMSMLMEADLYLVKKLRSGEITLEDSLQFIIKTIGLLFLGTPIPEAELRSLVEETTRMDIQDSLNQISKACFVEKC